MQLRSIANRFDILQRIWHVVVETNSFPPADTKLERMNLQLDELKRVIAVRDWIAEKGTTSFPVEKIADVNSLTIVTLEQSVESMKKLFGLDANMFYFLSSIITRSTAKFFNMVFERCLRLSKPSGDVTLVRIIRDDIMLIR